jgi:hypothetical protein
MVLTINFFYAGKRQTLQGIGDAPQMPRRAGQRVMESITQNLKLKLNEAKSAVARPQERKFLGFSFSTGPEVKRALRPRPWTGLSIASGRSRKGQRVSASRRQWQS